MIRGITGRRNRFSNATKDECVGTDVGDRSPLAHQREKSGDALRRRRQFRQTSDGRIGNGSRHYRFMYICNDERRRIMHNTTVVIRNGQINCIFAITGVMTDRKCRRMFVA